VIYVAQPTVGGPVKIGYTDGDRGAAHKRIAVLEPGCPWPLRLVCVMEGSLYDERQLHERFAEFRIHREWFRLEGALSLWLRGLAGDAIGPSTPQVPASITEMRPRRLRRVA
jgi:hypothetical protein